MPDTMTLQEVQDEFGEVRFYEISIAKKVPDIWYGEVRGEVWHHSQTIRCYSAEEKDRELVAFLARLESGDPRLKTKRVLKSTLSVSAIRIKVWAAPRGYDRMKRQRYYRSSRLRPIFNQTFSLDT